MPSPVTELKLRRARTGDLAALLDLMAGFSRDELVSFRRARVVAGLRRLLRERRLGVVVVAQNSDRGLEGYAVGTFGFDLEFAGPDAFLTELYVRPASRQLGLGARLLAAVTDALRDGGARAVTLLVRPENAAARRLYSSQGFAELPRLAMVRRLRVVKRRKGSGSASRAALTAQLD